MNFYNICELQVFSYRDHQGATHPPEDVMSILPRREWKGKVKSLRKFIVTARTSEKLLNRKYSYN